MTDLTNDITAAAEWCRQARELLQLPRNGAAKPTAKSKDIDKRVKEIVKQLTTLSQSLKTKRPDLFAQFVQRFTAIAQGLKQAAADGDATLVDQEALALSNLKKEIRVALLEAKDHRSRSEERQLGKARKRAEDRHTESGDAIDAAARHNFDATYGPIEDDVEAALAWKDVSETVKAAQAELQTANFAVIEKMDLGDYSTATGLVGVLKPKLQTAQAKKQDFDDAKAEYDATRPTFDPVLGWPDDLSPELNTLKQDTTAIRTVVDPLAARFEFEDAVQQIRTSGIVAKLLNAAQRKIDFDAAAVEYPTLQTEIAEVLAWTGALHPAMTGLQTKLRTDFAAAKAAADQRDFVEAVRLIKTGNLAQQAADAKQAKLLSETYAADRTRVVALHEALKKHAQKVHVNNEIQTAKTELETGEREATNGDFPKAISAVGKAEVACTEGEDFANKFAAFKKEFAKGGSIVAATKGVFAVDATWQAYQTELNAADNKAKTQRKYAEAKAEVLDIVRRLKEQIEKWYVKPLEDGLQDLAARTSGKPMTAEFIRPDREAIKAALDRSKADLAAGKWSRAIFEGWARSQGLLSSAKKFIARREAYDADRAAIVAKMAPLSAIPEFESSLTSMNIDLRTADYYASRQAMRIEKGRTALTLITATCDRLAALEIVITDYKTKRAAADLELKNLGEHAAKDHIEKTRSVARERLEQAGLAAGAADEAPNEWRRARDLVVSATGALNAAKAVAEGLGDALAAQSAAESLTDDAAVGPLVEQMRGRLQAASTHQHAAKAKPQLDPAKEKFAEAEARAKGPNPTLAQSALVSVSKSLIEVEATYLELAEFAKTHAAIEARRTAVLVPDKVKAKLDPVKAELDAAKACSEKLEHGNARDALFRAAAAVTIAETASRDRQAYDTREAALQAKHTPLADGKHKTQIGRMLEQGRKHADNFVFDRANKALARGEDNVEAAAVAAEFAKATPSEAVILAKVREITERGNGAIVDDLIKTLPLEGDIAMFQKLAKARFGVEMKLKAGYGDTLDDRRKEAVQTGVRIWGMLAKVPDDVRNNPSLKTVRREGGSQGGYYQGSDDLMVMTGRPSSDQGFGTDIKRELPHTVDPDTGKVTVDPDCEPVDPSKKVKYFDFATLHEVGHAVDDRLGFMNSRLGNDSFGGWQNHGGNIQPIAKAVAEKFDYSKQYVADLILGKSPSAPDPEPGKEATWDASKTKVDDWHEKATRSAPANGIWWDNSTSESIAIGGRVYQQAYSRTWVSYSLSARKKAITGYQFRAPGEWFAELYAAFHIGQLKSSHPASRWLKDLAK